MFDSVLFFYKVESILIKKKNISINISEFSIILVILTRVTCLHSIILVQ